MTVSSVVTRKNGAARPGAVGVEGRGAPVVRRRSLISFHPSLIVVAVAGAALVRQSMHAGLSGDVFYEVASGRWMLAHHAVLRHDVFTYSVPGRPWLDEEWGFQVLLAWLVAHVGPVAYWLVSGGACAGALAVGVALWRRSGAGWLWAAALAIVLAGGLSLGLDPRPQDLSYLFFALLLLLLSLARDRARWLVAVPPLMLVWANVHGSFLLGLAVLVMELALSLAPDLAWPEAPRHRAHIGWRALPRRPVLACLAVSLLATCANPSGPRLIAYALRVSSSSQLTSLIAEWQSPNFHAPLTLAVIAGPVLLLLVALALGNTTLGLGEISLALGLFLATLHAVRFAPYFDVAACTALARWRPLGRETLKPSVLSLPAALILAGALLTGPHVPAGAPQVTGAVGNPVAATDYLLHQEGRVFTTYWWGDYLDYRGVPVFVDGRTDLYFGTDVLATYVSVTELDVSPDGFLSRWKIRWVMWDRGSALSTYLSHDPRWTEAFKSQGAIVFERTGHG